MSVIVLAGGRSLRLGGIDKTAASVGGVPILHRIRSGLAGCEVVVVGPEVQGGPVPAIAAGLSRTTHDLVGVLAGDQPFVAGAVKPLTGALGGHDVAVLVADGRRQYLASLWRRDALRAALAALGSPVDAAVRRLFEGADAVEVPDTGGWSTDVDTPADLRAADRPTDGLTSKETP